MIQRIQTLYLALTAVFSALLPLFIPLMSSADGAATFALDLMPWGALFFVSAALALGTIFLYKNRQNQFVFNRLNIILNLFLLGFFVYRSLSLSGGASPEKGIGMLIPVLSIVLLVLANRAIKKDEDLVKSVDRLR
ncbi:DUF4293 domain-containing protein [Sediminicola luteus]|uniref:Transcription termination factor Rho n=1 Tax=Sediminicola luteus TaxID=319238 RepID=A0A2A4G9F0_9FLAO|nr:DUF4293 domain-containing protein [Sediminicola luteus]PCE64385.1 hypothetical protein B7P33_08815 [Sediminicola luteus]